MGLIGSNKTEEEKINEALEKFNIFEGVECRVIFPNTELTISTSSGLEKGAATLLFGIVGLAATSGFKHDEQNRELRTVFQVVEKGWYSI